MLTFSYSEQWRYKGSMKLRQPRRAEGASLSEQSNNKKIVRLLRAVFDFPYPSGHRKMMMEKAERGHYGKIIVYFGIGDRGASG